MNAPDEVNPAESLGERIDLFGPSIGNIVAGWIISFLMIIGGGALVVLPCRTIYESEGKLPFYHNHDTCWFWLGVLILIGLGLLLGSIFLIKYVQWLRFYDVELCVKGLRYREGDAVTIVLWSAAVMVRTRIIYDKIPIFKGPVVGLAYKRESHRYELVTRDGKELVFDGTTIQRLESFGQQLNLIAAREKLQWVIADDHDYDLFSHDNSRNEPSEEA